MPPKRKRRDEPGWARVLRAAVQKHKGQKGDPEHQASSSSSSSSSSEDEAGDDERDWCWRNCGGATWCTACGKPVCGYNETFEARETGCLPCLACEDCRGSDPSADGICLSCYRKHRHIVHDDSEWSSGSEDEEEDEEEEATDGHPRPKAKVCQSCGTKMYGDVGLKCDSCGLGWYCGWCWEKEGNEAGANDLQREQLRKAPSYQHDLLCMECADRALKDGCIKKQKRVERDGRGRVRVYTSRYNSLRIKVERAPTPPYAARDPLGRKLLEPSQDKSYVVRVDNAREPRVSDADLFLRLCGEPSARVTHDKWMRRVEGKGAMLHLVEDLCVLYAKPLPPPDDKHNVCACGVHLMRKRASNPESKNCGRLFLGCAFWKPGRTEGCCNAFRWLDEETPKKSSE